MAKKIVTNSESVGAGAAVSRAKSRSPRAKHSTKTAGAANVEAAPSEEQTPNAESATTAYTPDAAEVARLAYSYWEARGCQGGSPEEYWLRAERELRSRSLSA